MSVETVTTGAVPATGTLRIDFMFLDLTTCTRCLGTDRNLAAALDAVADVLRAAGTDVELNKVHVVSEQQAKDLNFVSSPTIRVNGVDVALELRESSCGSEPCTDGCGDGIACRVWVHDGHEYTEPPVEMIVDVILRNVYGIGADAGLKSPYSLPENLRRFFANATRSDRSSLEPLESASSDSSAGAGCCTPIEQETCCDPSAKRECCGGDDSGQGCGCQ